MTLGERIRPADVAISFERRGFLRRQARYLVQIPPLESTPPPAASALGVRQCRSWPKTRHYLDERTCVCPIHLISILILLSLTHDRFALRATVPRQSKDSHPPTVPFGAVQIQNSPCLLLEPAKSQRLQAQVSPLRGVVYLTLPPRTACRDPAGQSLARIASQRAKHTPRRWQIPFRQLSNSVGAETTFWSERLRRLRSLRLGFLSLPAPSRARIVALTVQKLFPQFLFGDKGRRR